jgi:lipopolysaccharide transport system permease protein
LVHPLVMLLSYTFVFQICLKQEPAPGEVTSNYTVFLMASYLPWLLFQDAVMRSSTVLVENSNLITKTVFPSEILPITVFLSSLLNHLLALGLMMAVIGIWTRELSMMALMLPVYMALLGLFAVGVGWIVSSLQVYLRDTAQMLTVIMTLWFWVTPIFISEQQIPESFRFLIRFNPLALVVRAYRERLLSYRLPDLTELTMLTAYSVAMFVLGGLFFRHLKRGFADVL